MGPRRGEVHVRESAGARHEHPEPARQEALVGQAQSIEVGVRVHLARTEGVAVVRDRLAEKSAVALEEVVETRQADRVALREAERHARLQRLRHRDTEILVEPQVRGVPAVLPDPQAALGVPDPAVEREFPPGVAEPDPGVERGVGRIGRGNGGLPLAPAGPRQAQAQREPGGRKQARSHHRQTVGGAAPSVKTRYYRASAMDVYRDFAPFYDLYVGGFAADLPVYLPYARRARAPLTESGRGAGRLTTPRA